MMNLMSAVICGGFAWYAYRESILWLFGLETFLVGINVGTMLMVFFC
jgi:hypothetical protein